MTHTNPPERRVVPFADYGWHETRLLLGIASLCVERIANHCRSILRLSLLTCLSSSTCVCDRSVPLYIPLLSDMALHYSCLYCRAAVYSDTTYYSTLILFDTLLSLVSQSFMSHFYLSRLHSIASYNFTTVFTAVYLISSLTLFFLRKISI